VKELNIADIRIDGGTQIRKELNESKIDEYLEQMADGAVFPPVVVFFDGSNHWLSSGFHRYWMHRKAGKETIGSIVKEGTLKDAILFALGDNKHGLNMSAEDYRRSVEIILNDEKWKEWSNAKIAQLIGISAMTVGRIKKERQPDAPKTKTYTDKHGNETTMDTSNIGKKTKPKDKPTEAPKVVEDENEYDPKEEKIRELIHTITELAEENTLLKDKIAVGQWDASEIEKIDIQETVETLREQIRILEIDNQALRESRDMFQNRNAELIKTVNSLKKKLKKGE